MTNAKVKVTKEIAEAIEDVRSVNYTDFQIIQDIVEDEGKTAYGTKMPILIKFAKYSTENQQTLFLALANGYEVEKTPEEMVAEQYRHHQENITFYASIKRRPIDRCQIEQERYSSGFFAGVEKVAEVYGLKIEGVDVK